MTDTDPEIAGVYDGEGSCYHALKDYDQALNYFNQAIDRDNQNTSFLMNRAQCYYDLGQYTDSINDLLLAL